MAKTVTVACKLPNGLEIEHKGRSVVLVGANSRDSVGGFGLTPEVDEDWFNDWYASNLDHPCIANDIIFANTPAKASDEAKEKKGVKTGLEPLDPDKLPKDVEQRKDD